MLKSWVLHLSPTSTSSGDAGINCLVLVPGDKINCKQHSGISNRCVWAKYQALGVCFVAEMHFKNKNEVKCWQPVLGNAVWCWSRIYNYYNEVYDLKCSLKELVRVLFFLLNTIRGWNDQNPILSKSDVLLLGLRKDLQEAYTSGVFPQRNPKYEDLLTKNIRRYIIWIYINPFKLCEKNIKCNIIKVKSRHYVTFF